MSLFSIIEVCLLAKDISTGCKYDVCSIQIKGGSSTGASLYLYTYCCMIFF